MARAADRVRNGTFVPLAPHEIMTASRPNLNVICGTLAAVGTGCGVLYNARGDGKRRETLQSCAGATAAAGVGSSWGGGSAAVVALPLGAVLARQWVR